MAELRTTRAYIAGFGTAGSLLAGAAVVFVLASAVVSFRGWPQLDNQLSAPALVRARAHASAGSPGAQRVATILAAENAASAPLSAPTARAAGGAGRGSGSGATSTTVATIRGPQVVVASSPRPAITAVSPARPQPHCSSGCGSGSTGSGLGGAVQSAAGALGSTVSGTGASLGSIVSGVAGSLASNVNSLSSSLAGTFKPAGQAPGHVVGTLLRGH